MHRQILFLTCLMAFATASAQTEPGCRIMNRQAGSITFEVDKDLPKVESLSRPSTADQVCMSVLDDFQIPRERQHILVHSLDPDQQLHVYGADVMYRMLCWAYAEHRPVALSPDMVWLLISQTFGQYVNANAERLRPMLVSHQGVKPLTVITTTDLLHAGRKQWDLVLNQFNHLIETNTRGNVAQTVTCDFTTTTPVTRIASQITLMEALKPFFRYEVRYAVCGIPSVTLTGTPADWRKVLAKAETLTGYGMGWWVERLRPVLREFVAAAEGHPRRAFWLDMMTTYHPDQLRGLGCNGNTKDFDGWFLTFFPDLDTKTIPQRSGIYDHKASEVAHVEVIYKRVASDGVTVIDETPLQLYAGFFGVNVDPKTGTMTPEIGWLVAKDKANGK